MSLTSPRPRSTPIVQVTAQQLNRCRADIIRQAIEYYRVVYEWQRSELMILVVRVGHRLEVYR